MKRRLVVGGAVALAAGIGVGLWRAPDAQPDTGVAEQMSPEVSDDHRWLIRHAALAASSHNAQPWRFRIGARHIAIEPDFSRRTPIVDPDDHHLFASLGCAAQNLAIAAGGLKQSVEIDPVVGTGGSIRLDLSASSLAQSALLAAIPERQCSRSIYDRSSVPADVIGRLVEGNEGTDAVVIADDVRRENILELVLEGNRRQLQDRAFRAELKSWLRFNPAAAARAGDGLLTASSGNPDMPDWLGSLLYDLTTNADRDNDKVAAALRSSSGLVVFSSDRDDPSGWVAAGRAYQRFALKATEAGLQHAFVNQAVEVPGMRAELQSLLNLGPRRANLVVRFGRGPQMPRSPRRPVRDVIVS